MTFPRNTVQTLFNAAVRRSSPRGNKRHGDCAALSRTFPIPESRKQKRLAPLRCKPLILKLILVGSASFEFVDEHFCSVLSSIQAHPTLAGQASSSLPTLSYGSLALPQVRPKRGHSAVAEKLVGAGPERTTDKAIQLSSGQCIRRMTAQSHDRWLGQFSRFTWVKPSLSIMSSSTLGAGEPNSTNSSPSVHRILKQVSHVTAL